MRWLSFLQQTVITGAGAAAGVVGTSVTANPLLGAAAGAAAKRSTEELLAEFLPAQQDALDELAERTQRIESILGDVRTDVRALTDAPWRAALLHIEDAATHPDAAPAELALARNLLYEAWGASPRAASRALIAQQLSIIYGMLGAPQDSHQWLHRSCRQSSMAVADELGHLRADVGRLPLKKAPRKLGTLPSDKLRLYLFHPKSGFFLVESKPLGTALVAVARSVIDFYRLRLLCATTGMREPWPTRNSLSESDAWTMFPAWPHDILISTRGEEGLWMVDGPAAALAKSILEEKELPEFKFRLGKVPSDLPESARFFISGSTPELGEWDPERAIPLEHVEDRRGDRWEAEVRLPAHPRSEPPRYHFLYVPEPGAPAVPEGGPPRKLRRQFEQNARWHRSTSSPPQ
jgi:Starch binding domain